MCLKITVSNLTDLLNKLGPDLVLQSADYIDEDLRLKNEDAVAELLLYVFKYVDDAVDLVQTIRKYHEYVFSNEQIFESMIAAKDTNLHKYINLLCRGKNHCVQRINTIFYVALDDSHLDTLIKHLKQLDNFVDTDSKELSVESSALLEYCIDHSFEHKCFKMRKALIGSKIFAHVKIYTNGFIKLLIDNELDDAKEMLTLINDNELLVVSLLMKEYWRLTPDNLDYLFDLIRDDVITLSDKDTFELIKGCCTRVLCNLFVYLITYYPLYVSHECLDKLKNRKITDYPFMTNFALLNAMRHTFSENKVYIKEMEKIIRVNEELMRELDEFTKN